MAKYNAQRFKTHSTTFGTTSGESPVLLPNSDAPETSPPGCSFFTEPPCQPITSNPIAAPPSQTISDSAAVKNPIRRARPQDLKFLSHLQKKFSNQLGFLPTQALQWYVEEGRVGVVTENGEPAGYVLGRPSFRYQRLLRPITQTAVAMDAQRRHLGMSLIDRVCNLARDEHQLAVQAVCAADLEANDFWLAMQFEAIHVFPANNTRGRELIVWRKLVTKTRPDWFELAPPDPGTRARRKQ